MTIASQMHMSADTRPLSGRGGGGSWPSVRSLSSMATSALSTRRSLMPAMQKKAHIASGHAFTDTKAQKPLRSWTSSKPECSTSTESMAQP